MFKADAKRHVREVLDLACGTGGPTIELAKRGYSVTGVDISKEMIKIARKKASKVKVKVYFRVGDMRKIRFKERFDAVLCLFTSINYNITDEAMESTMKCIYRSLKKGGVFIADTPNPYRAERWLKSEPIV